MLKIINSYEVKFHSKIDNIQKIIQNALLFLQSSCPGISISDINDLRLIYSELLCNAVIHGNKNDSSKHVCLKINIRDNTIFSTITDEGSGFDYMSLLNLAKQHKNLYEDHGRGILLVYSLADFISFNLSGNEIHFYKKVNQNGQNSYC